MLSTFLSYDLINRDIRGNLERVSQSSQVAREREYYNEKIGTVTDLDEFLDDYRLYSYAMKAHGLEDMTYAKAFMKKVLESDLSDSDSFANKLTDQRYRQFASSFQFSSDTAVTQTKRQIEEVIDSFKGAIEDEAEGVATETANYRANIGAVTSVDQLLGNERMRNYVLKAFDLDTKYWSKDHLTQVLTSDLNDPASYVNTTTASNKSTLQALTAHFNFNASGTLDVGVQAQDASQIDAVVGAYAFYVPSRTVQTEADLNKAYYEGKIGSITTADELVNDSRMLSYVKTAFGLEDITLKSTITNILTSDLNDPNNYATTMGGEAYEALTRAFGFATDGTLSGATAQTAIQIAQTSGQYMERYDDKQEVKDAELFEYYRNYIGTMDSIEELQSTPRIYDFVLAAFGFDPDEVKDNVIAQALTSDLSDPESFANAQKDTRYRELAEAFNFGADGEKSAPRLAQSQLLLTQTARDYIVVKTRFGNSDNREAADKEAEYYSERIQNIQTASEFLADRRLVDFVLVANGINADDVTDDFVKQVFESDLDDPDSFVNQQDDHRYAQILSSFNFDKNGEITFKESGIQGRYGMEMTDHLYLQQTLEVEAGNDNNGARLALYFKRMVPDINTPYDILGDTALLEVFRTAFSLPSEMSSMDIEKQAAIIEKYLDLEEMQDPDELEKFISRFTAMYDLTNNSGSDPTLGLFSGSSSISADTLLSIAQLKSA
ncbi:MAG: DUF1217 domain-containing protein [Rhizobium sp.]|nr:DUF1217 domain-containing protein [Rhizobium sp.]MBX9457778.1 DUF1217 domain-containing protein [Rhizobium sp.]